VHLIVTVISQVRSPDPDKMWDALSGIERFEGVTGIIAYPDASRIPSKSVRIIRIEGGRRSLAEQLLPTHVPTP
jgi:branched-chain amino acid transport system substrate-binding protein